MMRALRQRLPTLEVWLQMACLVGQQTLLRDVDAVEPNWPGRRTWIDPSSSRGAVAMKVRQG